MPDEHGTATPAQLKEDIDSGRTRDKVAAFDPAAAPLGTDEEAAGTPTPAWAIEAERRWRVENDLQARASGSPAVKWTGLAVLLLFLAATAIAWISMTPM